VIGRTYNVLFLNTGNSAAIILAKTLLDHGGEAIAGAERP
jgi:hypothetical protein